MWNLLLSWGRLTDEVTLSWDTSGRQEWSEREGIRATLKCGIISQQVPSHKTHLLIRLLSTRRKAKRDSIGEADKGYVTENLLLRDLDIIPKVIITVLKQASIQRQIQGFHVRSLWGNSQGLDLILYLMGRTLLSEHCPFDWRIVPFHCVVRLIFTCTPPLPQASPCHLHCCCLNLRTEF